MKQTEQKNTPQSVQQTDNLIAQKITQSSRETKQELWGKVLSYAAITLIGVIVLCIILFIAAKGVATFTTNKMSVVEFFTSSTWSPSNGQVGALAMIAGSFLVTILAAGIATPFAIATALFMTELTGKKMYRFLQSVIELLVGIPSVVYGLIGLNIVVPVVRHLFGGTGYGILAGSFVLFVMVLPTITSMTVDALKALPAYYKSGSLALGATRWQTIRKLTLKAATPGIITAVIFGMARAFGEALAVQMVIGNSVQMPTSLLNPAATLTSVLTMSMGNTVSGTLANNALWSLALVLLAMSLIFNIGVRLIGKKEAK